jgi:glycosyltransferase involved in cell wall biosynthesis
VSGAPAQSILALIPAYEAEPYVGDVVKTARTFLPVLVVDDGSKDRTSDRGREAGAEVVRQEPNQGKGAALQRGFRWALEQGYGAVLTLDADGQHDPAEIPKFLETYAKTHADLIIGARDFSQMPFVRRLSNTTARFAFSWAMGRTIRDNQSGYRLLSRRLIEDVLSSREAGFEFEMDMIVRCVRDGYNLDWVNIRTIYGDQGSHIKPIDHVVQFFRMIRNTRRAMKLRPSAPRA